LRRFLRSLNFAIRGKHLMSFASELLSDCQRIDRNIEDVGVAVWSLDLRLPSSAIESFLRTMSSDELSRAERLSDPGNRNRYIIAHGALRMILSDYTHVDPRHLTFVTGRHGKPSLARTEHGPAVRYNLSHSGDMAAIAVAIGHEVGIDIERIASPRAILSDAAQFLSGREITALQSLPKAEQTRAFFTCWTRKEAYLKGRGDGLSRRLRCFDVSVLPGESAALLGSRIDPEDVNRWRLFDVTVAEDYVATAAVDLLPAPA
jgi:4'-phosphopantetheinyl transferase